MAKFGLRPNGEPLSTASTPDGADGDLAHDEEERGAAAATVALAADPHPTMHTQGASMLFSLGEEELPGLALLDPDQTPAFPAGQGGRTQSRGAVGGAGRKMVSTPANDDLAPVGVVDNPDHTLRKGDDGDGNVRAPAVTDPLVDDGSTVGRTGAGQSQDQAGTQVQAPL